MLITKIDSGRSDVYLHTSDRNVFKRCRRKWYLSSPFRMHLQPQVEKLGVSPYLWFGSGIHWALEDYHGYNKFGDPITAFKAYINAHNSDELPVEIEELKSLGIEMLSYYVEWEKKYANWRTVWLDGKPLVEVNFALQLDELTYYDHPNKPDVYIWLHKNTFRLMGAKLRHTQAWLERKGFKRHEVSYGGTFDRIVEDQYGDWWVLDYKTAKQFDIKKLPLDPQVSAYCWAAEQWFGREIKGMLYVQLSKNPPKEPKYTAKGLLSTDKRQRTTCDKYKQALSQIYPLLNDAPEEYLNTLAYLKSKETENGNDFVRFDFVERNQAHKIMTYQHFIQEGKDMINPKIYLYPNPTMDCSWDCKFRELCIAMEEDADVDYYMEMLEKREEAIKDEIPSWRKNMYIQNPEIFPEKQVSAEYSLDEFINKCKEN